MIARLTDACRPRMISLRRTAARVIPPTLGLILVASASAPGAKPRSRGSSVAPMVPATRESLITAIQEERARTEKWLSGDPMSYLAAVRRIDFDEHPTLTLGSGPGNDLRIQDSTLAARHLSVTVMGDSFRVRSIDPAATFRVGDQEVREATLPPRTIGVGRFSLRLSHQRFPALIVFDPRSPHLAAYKGLDYYPVDLGYRFVVRLEPNPRADTTVILSTRGNQRRAVRAGWLSFTIAGRRYRLQATRLLEPGIGENDIGVFFKDATSGKETYGVGRYLDPEPLGDGRFVLDFNRAYNPACAFSDHYNCPIPPKENVLRVAIRAGEKDSHYTPH